MEDHEKLEKILAIRRRRENKSRQKHFEKRQELEEHEMKLQEERQKIEEFMKKRTVDLHSMQNRLHTENVSGHFIEQYLMLKVDTQKQIEEMYKKLEEKSQAYYPILDKVNEFYKEWDKLHKSCGRLEKTVIEKTEEFEFEQEEAKDKKLLDDFIARPK